MINHVSEIKAINLPVVTGSRERACACLRAYVQRFCFPCESGGVVFPISWTANRPLKTYDGSRTSDNGGKPLVTV